MFPLFLFHCFGSFVLSDSDQEYGSYAYSGSNESDDDLRHTSVQIRKKLFADRIQQNVYDHHQHKGDNLSLGVNRMQPDPAHGICQMFHVNHLPSVLSVLPAQECPQNCHPQCDKGDDDTGQTAVQVGEEFPLDEIQPEIDEKHQKQEYKVNLVFRYVTAHGIYWDFRRKHHYLERFSLV